MNDKNKKNSAAERRYRRVKKWTKEVNIFDKDFLIVPINKKYHWYLAIICYPRLNKPVYRDDNTEENEGTQEILNDSLPPSLTEVAEKISEVKKYRLRDKYAFDTNKMTFDSDSADEANGVDEDTVSSKSSSKNLGPCLKRPVILIFDSLRHSKKPRVIATLKQYVEIRQFFFEFCY